MFSAAVAMVIGIESISEDEVIDGEGATHAESHSELLIPRW